MPPPASRLFGARDVWFVVGVPVFLYANGWTFTMVGGFMALWTIFYGLIQAAAPAIVKRSADGLSAEVPAARLWSALLAATPALIIAALAFNLPVSPDIVLVVGLCIFGAAFAVNSSVHSYLILAYAGSEKAAEDVGFYYAANAAGRFGGTLLSGLLYQWGGINACLGRLCHHAGDLLSGDTVATGQSGVNSHVARLVPDDVVMMNISSHILKEVTAPQPVRFVHFHQPQVRCAVS